MCRVAAHTVQLMFCSAQEVDFYIFIIFVFFFAMFYTIIKQQKHKIAFYKKIMITGSLVAWVCGCCCKDCHLSCNSDTATTPTRNLTGSSSSSFRLLTLEQQTKMWQQKVWLALQKIWSYCPSCCRGGSMAAVKTLLSQRGAQPLPSKQKNKKTRRKTVKKSKNNHTKRQKPRVCLQ